MTDKSFTPPEIDYLSKDYASLRQVMRDHLATLLPDWQEQNPADIGNALLDLLAYAGDYLSYFQDAVATEAYLGTARRRVSIHRHTRLLDYDLHEGCNARVLVQVRVHNKKPVTLPKQTLLVTRAAVPTTVIGMGSAAYSQILGQPVHYFETMHPASLIEAHNEIRFYVPEGADVQLRVGATHAVLEDLKPGGSRENRVLQLKAGDILVFTEIRNPETGDPDTADPTHRHAVRLNRVFSYYQDGKPLLDIGWHPADVLPYPTGAETIYRRQKKHRGQRCLWQYDYCGLRTDNCDHLAAVEDECIYSPRLTRLILTYSEPLAIDLPIRDTLTQNPRNSRPAVQLWQVVRMPIVATRRSSAIAGGRRYAGP